MSNLKRILIFSLAYYPVEGGAEIAVKEITNRLPEFEFDLITKRFDPVEEHGSHGAGNSHKSFERVGNVNVYRIESTKISYPLKAFLKANMLHKQRSYEAIWSIMAAHAGLAGLLFKLRFPRVKFVLTLQEGDSLGHIKRRMSFLRPVFKMIFRKADVVQAISHFLADWGRSMGTREVVVIPNGVDVGKFQSVKSSAFDKSSTTPLSLFKERGRGEVYLITTSRLVEKNGVGDIIEALKFLPENVCLKILGTGPLEEVLKLKVKSLKLEHRVDFVGHVEYFDISKYLHKADIFIRPSISEGFGNSFIEAMAAGLPVIATQVGGIPDFLEHDVTGLFCEPRNPESIAREVKRLVSDKLLRDKIISNALKMVQDRYDWGLIAREMSSEVFG